MHLRDKTNKHAMSTPTSPTVAPSTESTPTTTEPVAEKALPSLTVDVKNSLREKIADGIVIVSHFVATSILPNASFRETIVRYLYKVNNNKHTPAIFTTAFINGTWAPECKETPIDSTDAKRFFPESSERALAMAQQNTTILSVDYIDQHMPLFHLRVRFILRLAGNIPNGAKPSSKQEQIKLEVKHKYLLPLSVHYEILYIGEKTADGADVVESLLNEIMSGREKNAEIMAHSTMGSNILDACVKTDVIADVLAVGRRAAEQKEPVPHVLFRVVCGEASKAENISVISKDEIAKTIEQNTKIAQSGVLDEMTTTYKAILDYMNTKAREPNTALFLVIHMHGGPLCGNSAVQWMEVDIERLAVEVEKERTARRDLAEKFQKSPK